MRTKLVASSSKGRLIVTYPFKIELSNEIEELFRATISLYKYSASKTKTIFSDKLTKTAIKILKEYYLENNIELLLEANNWPSYINNQNKIKGENNLVLFTSGKDSTYLLSKIASESKGKTYAIYIPNINKSETYYEKKSTFQIASKLGVELIMPDIVNSIKINRDGHNIGLREQLLLMLALPVAQRYNCSNLYLGVYPNEKPPELFAAWPETLKLTEQFFKEFNYNVNIKYFGENITEHLILKEMAKNQRELLHECTSCYSQLNFRETKHKRLKQKLPNIEIYKGCGSCIKCLRMNAALLPYMDDKFSSEKKYLKKYIEVRHAGKWSKDKTLTSLLNDLYT